MPSHRRLSTALVTIAAITASAGIAIAASDAGDEPGAPITLSGSVEGLTPGAARDLSVTIANPNAAALVVAAVDTAVTSPRAECPASALAVGDLAAPITVPAGASASGRLPVRLAADAPDACQGAVFALRFSAAGRGEGSLRPPAAPAAPTAPATPVTPSAPKTSAPGSFKTVTVKRRKKACRTRKVRIRGKVRRKKVCRVVIVKVKVRVPA